MFNNFFSTFSLFGKASCYVFAHYVTFVHVFSDTLFCPVVSTNGYLIYSYVFGMI